jgi:hypothetical protein
MPQVLFIAAFDSQLKWCSQIRTELDGRGFSSRVVVPDIRSALSESQIADAGFAEVERISWEETLVQAAGSDVVVCALSGPITKALTIGLAERVSRKVRVGPVLITGWVGIIIEKATAGYLDRCGSDIVAVNSVEDLQQFRRVADRLGLPADNLQLTGLPFLSGQPADKPLSPIRRVLFADQPTVPSHPVERSYLYEKLIEYARAHPDREVLLKPRHRPGEDTFHRMLHHPETLLAGVTVPPNFRIDYTPVSATLPTVDLLLTMSSTACLEAIDHGCRVALVLDLGIHERYGNHVFLDSGLLRTFSQIERDEIGSIAQEWQHSYFFSDDRSATQILADRAEELLASGERPSHEVWASTYYRSAAEFHRRTDGTAAPGGRAAAGSLRSRIDRHGCVKGAVAHMSYTLVPPALNGPLRSMAKKVGLL